MFINKYIFLGIDYLLYLIKINYPLKFYNYFIQNSVLVFFNYFDKIQNILSR